MCAPRFAGDDRTLHGTFLSFILSVSRTTDTRTCGGGRLEIVWLPSQYSTGL